MPEGGAADGDGMDRQPPLCANTRRQDNARKWVRKGAGMASSRLPVNPATRNGNTHEIGDNVRVISYNVPEGQRPGGIKVRFKIRVVTGKRAKEIDARQARAIM